jgi:hypothetical protein
MSVRSRFLPAAADKPGGTAAAINSACVLMMNSLRDDLSIASPPLKPNDLEY